MLGQSPFRRIKRGDDLQATTATAQMDCCFVAFGYVQVARLQSAGNGFDKDRLQTIGRLQTMSSPTRALGAMA